MLKGIRAKKISDYKAAIEKRKVEGVISSNHQKVPDVQFYLDKVKKEKFKHLRSEEMSYRYKGVNARPNDFVRSLGNKRFGGKGKQQSRQSKPGPKDQRGSVVMNFSKKEIDAINKGRR